MVNLSPEKTVQKPNDTERSQYEHPDEESRDIEETPLKICAEKSHVDSDLNYSVSID